MDGEQFAVACDHYMDWRDNARSIALYIKEKRKMSDRPVTTGQSEFATARLPSTVAEPPAHAVLGVDRDATDEEIKQAFRKQAKETHADQGGDTEAFKRVKRAKEAMLNE
jgi:DnaJ-class molecular chaperone